MLTLLVRFRQSRFAAGSLVILFALFLTSAAARAAITITNPVAANHLGSIALTQLPPGATGTVTLNPDPVTYLAPPAALSTFMTTFAADAPTQFPGWTATTGAALGGTVTINTYKARDYGSNNFPPPDNLSVPRGGADMNATYVPKNTDPAGLAWVQMFTSNTGPGGANVVHIDPFPNDGTDKGPGYYSNLDAGGINNLNFVDFPSSAITTVPFNRTKTFQLYLVQYDATKKTIIVDDGFSWGYNIVVVPEPASAALVAFLGASLLTARRRAA